MFQAYKQMWRRWVAGLVLVPGLSAAGVATLGLAGQAAAQDRAAVTSRADEIREYKRRAVEAYDANNLKAAKEWQDKARAVEAAARAEDAGEKPARATSRASSTKPAPSDPKALLNLAKQALVDGNLDKAHDLATQAKASSGGVRWGLFDDTPDSILKDVAKARGKRDRDQAEKLLTDARVLVDKKAASANERIKNLDAAEEKAKQAASLHGDYSWWDFGDRPANLIADVRKARSTERLASKVVQAKASDLADDPAAPRVKPPMGGYGSNTTVKHDESDDAPKLLPRSPEGAAKKKQAVALMQEGKALEISKNYVEARRKYVEAARLNASFDRDEDTPEAELSRLSVAAQRKITSMVNEARTCLDLKDMAGAHQNLDEAELIAKGMGLDASAVAEVRGILKPPTPVIRTGARTNTTTVDDLPLPIIRNGSYPLPGENQSNQSEPPTVIKPARNDESAEPTKVDEIIKPIPTNKGRTIRPSESVPAVPAIPDVEGQAEGVKPPAVKETVKTPDADKGQRLLQTARAELKKGDLEAARRMAVELINGDYDCKDEALAVLQSVDTKEAESKISSAKSAFENGLDAYHAHNYGMALSIFKQIDGTLLPADTRQKLKDMIAVSTAKKKEMDEATAARTGTEKLPTAPKVAPGVPDVPVSGPTPITRTGSDNLIKQQEALAQVEFQRLRTKALKTESEATARFGRGETDAALQDMQNFIAEVKSSALEAPKQNLLVRPLEARMERLRILKHQTDFLSKEAKDRRDFRSEMTQEALYKQKKQEEVAQLMRASHKLMDEAKYKEAYVQMQRAQSLDPDDPSVNASLRMADTMMRRMMQDKAKSSREKFNFEMMVDEGTFPSGINDANPLRWVEDKDYRDRVMKRTAGNVGVMRSRSEKEKDIERKMSTPLSVNFKSVPLEGVIDQIQAMTGINFDLDRNSLKEGNVDEKQPITANLKDVSLKSALSIICRQANLKHVIEHEAIRITTPKGAAGRQTVKSLSVGDLVIPAPNYGATEEITLSKQLAAAARAAYGQPAFSNAGNSRMTTPGAMNVGSSSLDIPGGGRIRNTPFDGGAQSNTGPANGTLEKELIRLITTTIKPDSWAALGGEGTIEYYPLGMAMVINQSPEVIEEVERLLESLRKLQDLEVSIEVKVVSLAETFYERIGVDFAMGIPTNAKPNPGGGTTVSGPNSQSFNGNVVGLQVPGVPTPDLDIPIRATSFTRAVPPFGGFTQSFQDGGISLGLAFLSDCQVQMFLEAAQGDTRTNVMQAPKLTALNGTSASMTVGDFQFFTTGITVAQVQGQLVFVPQNVPFQVGITQPVPPNASIQNGLINFTPTAPQTPGLGLFIQPVVSADRRFVRLNIQQSFVSLVSGTQQIPVTTVITPQFENGGTGLPVPFTQFMQQPRFSNLETQTVVVVPDGGTVVMGGLKYMTEGRNEFGPPVLSKIPYLNRLFKNVAYGREGRSILIMVTPRVIINREEQERQTGVKDEDYIGFVGP